MSIPIITQDSYRERFDVDDMSCNVCTKNFQIKRNDKHTPCCPGCYDTNVSPRLTAINRRKVNAIDEMNLIELRNHLENLSKIYRTNGRLKIESLLCHKIAILNILLGEVPVQDIPEETT